MIVGTGIDLVEIGRIQQAMDRFGERFLQRVFTPAELRYCLARQRGVAESLAARFAAKEACAKALGTGITQGVSWCEMEVERLSSGQPAMVLHGRAAEQAKAMGVAALHLSLSHNQTFATAIVVLESAGPLVSAIA